MRKLFIALVCLWLPLQLPVSADENDNLKNNNDLKKSAPVKPFRGDVCVRPSDRTDTAYLADMKDRFYRNLSPSVFLAHDVVLRFFLTGKGSIRDISVVKSSGSQSTDMGCVDAAYCASPLPAPSVLRVPLKAPPDAYLYEPHEYGEGIYTFTFHKNPGSTVRAQSNDINEATSNSVYELPLIPEEVSFRYPELFTRDELTASSNKISVKANPYFLECMRSPWALQYTLTEPPTKTQLLDLSRSIRDRYVTKKGEWLRSNSRTVTK